MKHFAFGLALGVSGILWASHAAAAQPLYTCGQGSVRSIQSVVAVTEPAIGQSAASDGLDRLAGAARTESHLVAVQLDNVVYTGRAAAGAPWNFDPTTLVPGEPISVCVNGVRMVLDRLDGTDYRAAVVHVDRRSERKRQPVSAGLNTRLER